MLEFFSLTFLRHLLETQHVLIEIKPNSLPLPAKLLVFALSQNACRIYLFLFQLKIVFS